MTHIFSALTVDLTQTQMEMKIVLKDFMDKVKWDMKYESKEGGWMYRAPAFVISFVTRVRFVGFGKVKAFFRPVVTSR